VARRIGVDVLAGQLRCAQSCHPGSGRGDVLNHDIEVDLLWHGRIRPRRRSVIRGELEGKAAGRIAGGDDHPVGTGIGDGLPEQGGVERCQGSRVRAVEYDMVQTAKHVASMTCGIAGPTYPPSGSSHGDRWCLTGRMGTETDSKPVALVAGATRGAGRAIAVELARAGFFVYATGRSSRTAGRSEMDRPETIEETADLIRAAGGVGAAAVVDHEDPDAVADLVASVERERGGLDVLVNDIFGGDRYAEWNKPLWEHDWPGGLRMLQMGVHTHLITCRAAIPLMLHTPAANGRHGLIVEMTDGTAEANAPFRRNVGFYYDLVKANVERIVTGLTAELEGLPLTAVGVTPGWLRSEKMLENFGVTEPTWREACVKTPGFAISESPAYVARGVAALAASADAHRYAGTILSARQLADTYGVTDTDGSKPDCWGYLAAYGWDREDGAGIDDFR